MDDSNVKMVTRNGTIWANVDNAGQSDAGAAITTLIETYWDEGGLDMFLAPGTYLIETPIVVTLSNVSIQGYGYGFTYHVPYMGVPIIPEGTRATLGQYGKTRFVVAPSCDRAIQLGPVAGLLAFSMRNIAISGQNGRVGVRPNVDPEQNGIVILPGTPTWSCVIEHCQFIHLTHGIINQSADSFMDVWSITDNWISECNTAIKLHTSLWAVMIARNGFHDMTGTVLELRSPNHNELASKEVVISHNNGWNPGRLVFDLDGFRGGVVSDNAFDFDDENVQCFARLRSCYSTNVSGNTFVVDGPAETRSEHHEAMGYEENGERYDTLTIEGCSDCTVSSNTLLSYNRERPVISVGGRAGSNEPSRSNHVMFNKLLPSKGYEGRTQIELGRLSEANVVLLPMAVDNAESTTAVRDLGVANEVCALPAVIRR